MTERFGGDKRKLWLAVGIALLYFMMRLPNLTLQPVFADEAIYIRWAQIAKAEPSLRFVSLQDGKTPLFIWLMAPFLAIFADPLFAGRLLSVISGFFTLLGVFFLGKRFFNIRVGLWSALLVAITPFMFFFDRMALVDSMLAAFTIWVVYFGLKTVYEPKIRNALFLGLVLAGGWLTKTPGMVNIPLLALLMLPFGTSNIKDRERAVRLGKLLVMAILIAFVIYYFQKIDPNFHQLASRNSDYVHPWSRLLQYPFDPLVPHLKDSAGYLWSYLGLLEIVLILAGAIYAIARRNKVALVLLLWFFIPATYELTFIKAFTARYLLFLTPPLLLIGGWVIDRLVMKIPSPGRRLAVSALLVLLLSIWPGFFASRLLTDPASAPLPSQERRGYLEDWTAGYGLKDMARYLITQSRDQTVVVGTEGSFGTLPDGLLIYLDSYFHRSSKQKVVVLGGGSHVSADLRSFASERPTFFVANRSRYPVAEPGLERIMEFPKARGKDGHQDALLFYRVTNNE